MRSLLHAWPVLCRFVAVLLLGTLLSCGSSGGPPPALTPGEILSGLGAEGRAGLSPEQLDAYAATFGFLDTDADGVVTLEEYEENSIFRDPAAVRGVFAATDRDGDGGVTVAEYVENRIITDEAKTIFGRLDEDGDGGLTLPEFEAGTPFTSVQAADVFARFDTSADGVIGQTELLRVWGNWARLPEVDLG
ncbi:MAG: hypothetical protein VCC00_04610 [Deltaproteobacteria bacterium]